MAAGTSGCVQNETKSQQVLSVFTVPEPYHMVSSLVARIHSDYVYDADNKQYALITEEIDQTHYSQDSYLDHLSKVRGNKSLAIDKSQVVESDYMIACRQEVSGKLECYINAKVKCRDASIIFQHPGEDEEAAKEIVHSYLNSIGEEDKDYVYSSFLTKLDEKDKQPKETTEDEPEEEVKDSGAASTAEENPSEPQENKPKTADDFITVIDKSASHSDER